MDAAISQFSNFSISWGQLMIFLNGTFEFRESRGVFLREFQGLHRKYKGAAIPNRPGPIHHISGVAFRISGRGFINPPLRLRRKFYSRVASPPDVYESVSKGLPTFM